MTVIYSIDFETRSNIDLPDRGLDVYANDPSTEVLCIAYGTKAESVLVQPPELMKYSELMQHVLAGGKIAAWNAAFEYAIWNCVCVPKYGWPPLKLEQCIDTMAMSAACNAPQSLEDAAMFFDSTYKKDPIGKKLIQKLCKPHKGEFNNDPELLKQLFEYCRTDVKTEIALQGHLRPLSAIEQEIWCATLRVNLLGVPIASYEVENAVTAVKNAQKELDDECLAVTGYKPSERAKLLNWLNERGANMTDLTSDSVSKMLQCSNLDEKIRRVLELRRDGSQTSTAKYAKMLDIQRGDRIRNTLVYHGASTGRWASRGGLNLQNIARPTISDEQIEKAIPSVFGMGRGTMDELSSLVRAAIKAPDGKLLMSVDFSSIENRVSSWLAGQTDKVQMFTVGLDEYKVFASEALYRVPYDEVTKDQRQIAKSAVLGCCFGQGAKGLVKYADGMGVKMTEAQAKNAVDSYRAAYPKVKNLWAACESAAIDAIQDPGVAKAANSKIKLKVIRNALWMQLPSGRLLCWQRPEVGMVMTPWAQERLGITVHNQSTYTRIWGRNQLIGSSVFQSAVQSIARDLLAEGLLRLQNAGYEVVNLVHDEFILIVDEVDAEEKLKHVIELVTTPPAWAQDLPLAAEGWVKKRYGK